MRILLFELCWLAAVLLAQQPPADQSGAARFESNVRMVVEVVTVSGKGGNPIEGLTADDFAVTENGAPQRVAFCEFQKFDASPVETLLGAPERSAPVEPAGSDRYQARRLLALYFDRSAMPQADQYRAYAAASKFVQSQMTRADLVSILMFSEGRMHLLQDFTSDRQTLLSVLGRLMEQDASLEEGANSAFGQDDDEFNVFTTDRQLAALQSAARSMARVKEKKAIVYFASGARFASQQNLAQMRALVNAARQANVSIFTIDARGLVAWPAMGDASQASPGGLGMYTGETAAAITSAFERTQDALYALASDTGGKALLNYNDLSAGIVQAQKAYTSHYLIGYYSSNTERDGKFRRVAIALRDHRPARLDYRPGYFGEKSFGAFTGADKERQLEDALMLEDPVTDLPLALTVDYFQLNPAEYYVPVVINIPGSDLVQASQGSGERVLIDLIGEIKDADGRTIQNLRDKVDVRLSPAMAAQVSRGVVKYDTGYTLLPGKYAIKVLARDSRTGRIGTYISRFAIPNLNKVEGRVPISSVVLSSERVNLTEALFTVGKRANQANNPLVRDGRKLIPSVTRVFRRNGTLFVYLQAYQAAAPAAQPLVAYVTFLRAGAKAFETDPVEFADALSNRLKTTPVHFEIPLGRFEPGQYDCQVTVIDWKSEKASFWQAPVYFAP